ncbi:MAG: PTS ascorbate transporter subunit IIC [Clostridiales bacterium]|nr:PTS ascorbate transporter subunit IIC [Clostridiales bacterium]
MELILKAEFLVVIFVVTGLFIQQKRLDDIVSSTIKVLMGYYIIVYGSNLAVNTLGIISLIFRRAFHAFDIIPNNETIASIIQLNYSQSVILIMIIAMIVNITIARTTKYKYVFLSIYYLLYISAMMAVITNDSGNYYLSILVAGIFVGIIISILPHFTSGYVSKILGNDNVTIGFLGNSATFLGIFMSNIIRTKKEINNKVKNKFFVRDSNIILFLSMFLLFIILTSMVDKDFLYDFTSERNRIYVAIKYSINFTVSFYLIVLGVRMMTGEIVNSYKGIAEKIIPNSKIAVDPAVIFSHMPNIVLIGFLVSLLGGIISFFIQLKLKMNVVVPAVITHFFSGGTAAILGYNKNKIGGAIITSFIHGAVISFFPILLMPLLKPHIGLISTCFSDADFLLIALLFSIIKKLISIVLGVIM